MEPLGEGSRYELSCILVACIASTESFLLVWSGSKDGMIAASDYLHLAAKWAIRDAFLMLESTADQPDARTCSGDFVAPVCMVTSVALNPNSCR
jgi:hypothetical protein